MSLFENDQFQWRETYFVLFPQDKRPAAGAMVKSLKKLGSRYEISEIRKDDEGRVESLTLVSPYDFAAMDISYVDGEEVVAQVAELKDQLKQMTLTAEDIKKAARLSDCNARFDVYHFEQVVDDGAEDEFLDPGALLLVLERLVELTDGVSVDPQSGSLV